jgi:hypothetical protein
MNRNTLLTVGVLALVAYFVFRKKPDAKEKGQAPNGSNTGSPVEGLDKGTVAQTTASLKLKGIRPPKRKLLYAEQIKVVKDPVVIAPLNTIPSVYDRGVGQAIPLQSHYNMSGVCSENIESACKCASKNKEKYTFDIPSFL